MSSNEFLFDNFFTFSNQNNENKKVNDYFFEIVFGIVNVILIVYICIHFYLIRAFRNQSERKSIVNNRTSRFTMAAFDFRESSFKMDNRFSG